MRIVETKLDISREPLLRPFGFKGASFSEKWLTHVKLKGQTGQEAEDLAGLAVLWSDARVFLSHTEVGGNILMAAMLEHALARARETAFSNPPELLQSLIEPVHAYGREVTGHPELRRTFTLNSMVALDHAAWRLYAMEHALNSFDQIIPPHARPAMAHRHEALACVPLLSYELGLDEIRQLVDAGAFLLKIKIGAAGDPAQMLEADLARLKQIHEAVGDASTPHTDDGRIRYYLDANGRYPDRARVQRLMDGLDRTGMREQVLLLEEPFPEEQADSVDGLGALVAADESLHSVADLHRRVELGYSALALKPAGKTLSLTFDMAAEAHRLGVHCFVADSACTPRMMDFNRNVAARLAPLPGLRVGCLESNGPQHYRHWRRMLAEHPAAGAPWLEPLDGIFQLDEHFYRRGGRMCAPSRTAQDHSI